MHPPHSALSRFLNRLLIRSPLTSEEQEAILGLDHRVRNISPREDVISPGERTDHSCLVSKGLVARFDQMRSGERQITAFYLSGDMCDLHSVVAPTAAWGISAMTASHLLLVPHRALRELADTYPAIAYAFWRDLTADASVLAKWVGNLGRRDARARIAHLLCEFVTRMELAGLSSRASFTFDATQEQIADATGLTAVHVNRTMQRLRGERVIGTRGRTVEVLDWDLLSAIAEFDPAYLMARRSNIPARDSADRQFAADQRSGNGAPSGLNFA